MSYIRSRSRLPYFVDMDLKVSVILLWGGASSRWWEWVVKKTTIIQNLFLRVNKASMYGIEQWAMSEYVLLIPFPTTLPLCHHL